MKFLVPALLLVLLSSVIGIHGINAAKCETASQDPGTVKMVKEKGVTLMDTNEMFVTGDNTPCNWTIVCPSGHKVLFQLSSYNSNKNRDSTRYSEWYVHDSKGADILYSTTWAEMTVQLLDAASVQVSFMSKLTTDDSKKRRQYAYVGCIPIPSYAASAVGDDQLTRTFSGWYGTDGDDKRITKGNGPRQIVMLAAKGEDGDVSYMDFGISEVYMRSISFTGSGTKVEAFYRDGRPLGTYTNGDNSDMQSHEINENGWGFIFVATKPVDWELVFCVDADCDGKTALIIGLAVGLGLGIPLVIGILVYCFCARKKDVGNSDNKQSSSRNEAVLTVTTAHVRPAPAPAPRREVETAFTASASTKPKQSDDFEMYSGPAKPAATSTAPMMSSPFHDNGPLFASGGGGGTSVPPAAPYQDNATRYPTANAFYSGNVQGVVVESAAPQPTAAAYNDGRPLTDAQMRQMATFMKKNEV